jgi:hypothetical protein
MPHETAAYRKPATLRSEIDDRCSLRARRRKTPPQLRKFIGAVFEAPNDGCRIGRPDIVAGFKIGRSGRELDRRADLAECPEVLVVGDAIAEIVAHRRPLLPLL